jgi:predicted Zn-dependent protease
MSDSTTLTSEQVANQANELILRGQVEEALNLFKQHLGHFPFDSHVQDLVESLLLAPDQGRGLVDFFRDLQKSYPDDWRQVVNLARAYSKTGKDSLAVVQLQKLLRAETQHCEVWMELATCYRRLDKLELALRALNSLIEVQADHGPAHMARIRYLVESGDLEEAAAATIFSLEVKGLAPGLKDWLDKVNLELEQGKKPDDELLYRSN